LTFLCVPSKICKSSLFLDVQQQQPTFRRVFLTWSPGELSPH
jgi:hypothetical protein